MATATLPSSPSFPQFTITSEEISRYAELTSLLSQLKTQQKTMRAELLELYEDGAEQEETGLRRVVHRCAFAVVVLAARTLADGMYAVGYGCSGCLCCRLEWPLPRPGQTDAVWWR